MQKNSRIPPKKLNPSESSDSVRLQKVAKKIADFGLVKTINLHFSKAKAFYTYLQRTVFCQASTLAELLLVVEVLRDLKHLSIFFRVVKTLPGIRFLSLPNLRLTGFNGNFVCDDFFRQTHPNSVEMRMNHFVKSEF